MDDLGYIMCYLYMIVATGQLHRFKSRVIILVLRVLRAICAIVSPFRVIYIFVHMNSVLRLHTPSVSTPVFLATKVVNKGSRKRACWLNKELLGFRRRQRNSGETWSSLKDSPVFLWQWVVSQCLLTPLGSNITSLLTLRLAQVSVVHSPMFIRELPWRRPLFT